MSLYNLLEYNSNYSGATSSLWFYSKDETHNFNSNIVNNDVFKSFKYKGKLSGSTEADGANGILRSTTTAVSLKHLDNFWRSFEMLLMNCKS